MKTKPDNLRANFKALADFILDNEWEKLKAAIQNCNECKHDGRVSRLCHYHMLWEDRLQRLDTDTDRYRR